MLNPSFVSCMTLKLKNEERCFHDWGEGYRTPLYKKFGIQDEFYFEKSFLSVFSFFKSLPLSLKPFLYQSQYWTSTFSPEGFPGIEKMGKEKYYHYLYLRSLAELSYVDANDGQSQFIFLWTEEMHSPTALDEGCLPPHNMTFNPYGRYEMKLASICYLKAITEWFEWMKRKDVYDNTKVIIVADHGSDEDQVYYEGAVNPLLMVKDYGARGPLKTSPALMVNADALSLICSGIGSCEGVEPDPTKHTLKNRSATFSLTHWEDYEVRKNKKTFDIYKTYVITEEDIKNPNWREAIQG